MYASYSTGFKAPVSANFFVPIAAIGSNPAGAKVNAALKPEKGTQYEIGTKGSVLNDRLSYELTAFRTLYTDKMTAVAVKNPNDPAGTTLYTITANGGKQNHKGLKQGDCKAILFGSGVCLSSLRSCQKGQRP